MHQTPKLTIILSVNLSGRVVTAPQQFLSVNGIWSDIAQ